MYTYTKYCILKCAHYTKHCFNLIYLPRCKYTYKDQDFRILFDFFLLLQILSFYISTFFHHYTLFPVIRRHLVYHVEAVNKVNVYICVRVLTYIQYTYICHCFLLKRFGNVVLTIYTYI